MNMYFTSIYVGFAILVLVFVILKESNLYKLVSEIKQTSRSINFKRQAHDNKIILIPKDKILESYIHFQDKIMAYILKEGKINKFKRRIFLLFGIKIDALETDHEDGSCLIGYIATAKGTLIFM